jgi:predicted ATPase/DNA-binding winged helix-turn-helix (wHTH) protein
MRDRRIGHPTEGTRIAGTRRLPAAVTVATPVRRVVQHVIMRHLLDCRDRRALMAESLGRSVSFGPFRLFPGARMVEKNGARLALGSRALDILTVLVDRAGEIVAHRELTQLVWRGLVVSPGSLRVHVAGLRKALGDSEAEPRYVANVPGQGYCFVAQIRREANEPVPQAEKQPPLGRDQSGEQAAQPSSSGVANNLPRQRTSFVGREKEVEDLKSLLASARLVTLTGSGGCGKSRLAVQVATQVPAAFPDGCWLVELASLDDPMLIAQTIAKVLGVREQGSDPAAAVLAKFLETKHLLLVLDNAEHLVESTAYLVDLLLHCCSGLQILATSREPLNVNGEVTYRVPSLSLPGHDAVTREAVMASEAARLFVERARMHRHDFDVSPKDAKTLASICRRLDGIALAIELAAPRLRTMTLEELNKRLDDRFGTLGAGHRTAPPRHRTLRSLIDWSYDLLSAAEKIVLRRLAVFAGGCTSELAEAVCAGDGVEREQVFNLLTSLSDKSLLVAEVQEDAMRFRMLETLRQYASELLRNAGDESIVRSLHLQVFADLAESFSVESEALQVATFERLDRELDNLRVALAWCDADLSRAEVGLQIAGKLGWFWVTRGFHSEVREWIERFLAAPPDGPGTEVRARALTTAGGAAYQQGDYSLAASYYRDAIPIYERLGLRHMVGRQLLNLGAVAAQRADFSEARKQYEASLILAREAGDSRHISGCLYNLGFLACQTNDFERASSVLGECLSISREAGNWSTAGALQQLGRVRHAQGQHEVARTMLLESLDLHRAVKDSHGVSQTLYYLGMVSHDLGDTAVAMTQVREALSIGYAIGDRFRIASTLEVVAGLSVVLGNPKGAARIWGQAERLREDIGTPPEPLERNRVEREVACARTAAQDDRGFDLAWHEGRAMTIEAAVGFAMNL